MQEALEEQSIGMFVCMFSTLRFLLDIQRHSDDDQTFFVSELVYNVI